VFVEFNTGRLLNCARRKQFRLRFEGQVNGIISKIIRAESLTWSSTSVLREPLPFGGPIVKTEMLAPQPLLRRFMPELDGLRGIAILGVLFFHGFRADYGELPFTGVRRLFILATQPGALGVNLFFVLSGFLITGILLDSQNRPDYYRRFYVRRALRILPAYYSLLVILGLLHQASAAFLGMSFVYLSNVTSLFGVSMDYHPLWSLAVEEHYYIVWPSVVRKLKPGSLALFSLAICVLVPIARAVAFHYGHMLGGEWYTWFAADGLAAGSLLAIALRSWVSRRQAMIGAITLLTLSPALIIAAAPFGMLSRQSMLGASLQLTLVNSFFAGILVLFLLIGSSARSGLVHSSFLQFFGYISYGLYLIHPMIFRIYDKFIGKLWPSLVPATGHFGLIVLRFAVVSGAAVGLSYLSRKYYEEWFLQLKDRISPEPPPKISVKVVVETPSAPASVTPREASESL
jgi:peptidoglycan/LPS O-acetylase OafA/YrhL